MEVRWAELKIPDTDFDVVALYRALDARRSERGMSWRAVAHEVNRADERYDVHPISPSTISGLKNKRWGVEGDGVLQMLLWLDRTPESFVPFHPGAGHSEAQLPRPSGRRALQRRNTEELEETATHRISPCDAAGTMAALSSGHPDAPDGLVTSGSLCQHCSYLVIVLVRMSAHDSIGIAV